MTILIGKRDRLNMNSYKVTFQPDGIQMTVNAPITLMEAAQRSGIVLNTVCGGVGTCHKCMVKVSGLPEPVRACQHRVDRDMTVTIPESSRFFEQKILQEGISRDEQLDPLLCKHYLKLSPSSLEDLRSDTTRLIDAVEDHVGPGKHTCRDHSGSVSGRTRISWDLLRKLPAIFRNHDYAVTVVCHSGRIFTLEPGDTSDNLFGLAVDVGTTTVVAQLIDLISGKTLAIASQTNPQVSLGDDVIRRIEYTTSQADGLEQLQHRIVECLNHLIAEVCKKSLVNHEQIYEMTAAGNATMQHLLLGIPVEQIAQSPYVAAVSSAVNVPAGSLGINIHPEGNIYVLPSVAAHIGGDTVGVAVTTAMQHSEKINLALDIGTNGEIILGNKDRLVTCSTAAGPAFEGARIGQGMRGAHGAIERVKLDEEVKIAVIGSIQPTGICGSGLIDAVAELLRNGIVDYTGRLLTGDELPDTLNLEIKQRVVENDKGSAFVLVRASQTKHGKDIVLTQRDIREAQLAKAAIRAGITTLMNELEVQLEDIDRLFLAGAFGNYVRPESARRIGLIPNMKLEKIQTVGNAAGTGARLSLQSRKIRQEVESLAQELDYVELAGRTDFQNIFSECMFFPEA